MNLTYGLIGNKLSHSFSKNYFTKKFEKEGLLNYKYELFELNHINQLNHLINNTPELNGLNVTIPFKESVIPYLSEINNVAYKIGAVNTIKIYRTYKKQHLHGYNTDAPALLQCFNLLKITKYHKVLILGYGGAAKSTVFVCKDLNINYLIVSRRSIRDKHILWDDISEKIIKEYNVIINATPLGMFPEINNYPNLPYASITNSHIIFDMVYNPEKTLFLQFAENHGAKIMNGLTMLKSQADYSWDIWNNPEY